MIGRKLSHYEILGPLGEGGMGEVYLARDTSLDREVALKFLPHELAADPERVRRFRREAKTLAALNHPNIVTMHALEEVEDTCFLAMERIRGKTLAQLVPRAGMPLDRLFRICVPLADALAVAHEHGIVHRDLKPANIMVTDGGVVKILDFGLAKLRFDHHAPTELSQAETELATAEGRILGTLPYISPEQLEGKPADPRSDVFSLGVILYELAAGEPPFRGDGPASLVSAILRDSPRPLDEVRSALPRHLARIVRRCLEKDPEHRYQSAKDVRNELADLERERRDEPQTVPPQRRVREHPRAPWLIGAAAVLALVAAGLGYQAFRSGRAPETEPPAAATAERPRIAVLPFENLGPPDERYFAAGMTEELISRLAAVQGLSVISRVSAIQYDPTGKTAQQIGADLGVEYLLEGTVRWAGEPATGPGRLRLTLQLIGARDDSHLWAMSFDRELKDIFAVQTEIAERVIDELGVTLLGAERAALEQRPTDHPDAYQAYLRGLDLWAAGNDAESWRLAAEMFDRAVELDPGFYVALARKVQVLVWLHLSGFGSEDLLGEASEALRRAQALAPEHPRVRLAAGYYHYHGFRDYERALAEFRAAEAALPGDGEVHGAVAAVLRRQGRFAEALESFERQQDLGTPAIFNPTWDLALTLRAMRRYAEADRQYAKVLATSPDRAQFWQEWAELHVAWTGVAAARRVLAQAPELLRPQFREIHAYLNLLEARLEEVVDPLTDDPRGELAWLGAYTYRRLGSAEEAEALARRRIDLYRQRLDSSPQLAASPRSAFDHSSLGRLEALLGHREEALHHGRLAVELLANDALWGPVQKQRLAITYALVGDHGSAIRLIEELLATDYPRALSPNLLRLEPWWDPLRTDPAFRRLAEAAVAEER